MLSIHDGRSAFYQWDSGQKLRVTHPGKICEVHYKNPGEDTALVVDTYDLDGQTVANVPNILLQTAGKLTAYVYICVGDSCTVDKTIFDIKPRPKPADYVYTETEIKTYEALEKRLDEMEGGMVSDEQIEKVLTEYLEENPIGGVTPEEVAAEVEKALEEAKESGEFDGPKGDKGEPGNPGDPGPAGYTPEKGKDYWTEADKEEIKGYIDESVSNLPSGGGVSALKRVASVIVGADETYKEFEITGLNLKVPFSIACGTRNVNEVWDPGNGVSISLNGQKRMYYRGSLRDARAWFFDVDGKVEGAFTLDFNASYCGSMKWDFPADTTITSICISNPYAGNPNNTTNYFGEGFFVEVWSGVYPNVSNIRG